MPSLTSTRSSTNPNQLAALITGLLSIPQVEKACLLSEKPRGLHLLVIASSEPDNSRAVIALDDLCRRVVGDGNCAYEARFLPGEAARETIDAGGRLVFRRIDPSLASAAARPTMGSEDLLRLLTKGALYDDHDNAVCALPGRGHARPAGGQGLGPAGWGAALPGQRN